MSICVGQADNGRRFLSRLLQSTDLAFAYSFLGSLEQSREPAFARWSCYRGVKFTDELVRLPGPEAISPDEPLHSDATLSVTILDLLLPYGRQLLRWNGLFALVRRMPLRCVTCLLAGRHSLGEDVRAFLRFCQFSGRPMKSVDCVVDLIQMTIIESAESECCLGPSVMCAESSS